MPVQSAFIASATHVEAFAFELVKGRNDIEIGGVFHAGKRMTVLQAACPLPFCTELLIVDFQLKSALDRPCLRVMG